MRDFCDDDDYDATNSNVNNNDYENIQKPSEYEIIQEQIIRDRDQGLDLAGLN